MEIILNSLNSDTTNYILKTMLIVLGTLYIGKRINNNNISIKNVVIEICLISIFSVICSVIKNSFENFSCLSFLLILAILLFKMDTKNSIVDSVFIIVIALAISYSIFFLSAIFTFIINYFIKVNNRLVELFFITIIYAFLIKMMFKIKRFKYGFAFLKDKSKKEYMEFLILNIGIIILFVSMIFFKSNLELARSLTIWLVVFSIIMFITIQKSLQLYYKQKMLIKELDETKEDLARAENKIKILERENIEESKERHTVIHKQKSLEYKIEEMLTKTEMSTEEAAEVKERLEKLNKEIYTEKEVMELDKTGISSIDDMLKYMQSECVKNKIDFTLQIKGNIHYMVHNLVKEEELETLLADHIKDAIIAINHTDNANRSILVRLGNIDDIYSLYIYDSGVEFKPEVLESLGKKPCTTYASEGGTGMGFMNTFDTVRKHKASLIIEEIGKPTEDNYTKAIIIKFDKKNEFKVKSYHEIEKV